MPHAVLIAGPTASGKSALAMELANEFGGVIINADSMQVYRELRIITNRPSPEEEAQAPHRLYGFRSATEPYSAALWLDDVRSILDEAADKKQLAIIVGGTGLYFSALTEGLSAIPSIPAAIREHYRNAAETQGADVLYAELARRDPLTASRLRPADPQRIVRALEVLEATGRPLAEWQSTKEPPLMPLDTTFPIALIPERDELYRRCGERFDMMLRQGAIEEARSLAGFGLTRSLPAMRAVGLPPLIAYVEGQISLDEAATQAKTSTRNYAKRQTTWINSNFSSWNRISSKEMKRIKQELNIIMRNRLTPLR